MYGIRLILFLDWNFKYGNCDPSSSFKHNLKLLGVLNLAAQIIAHYTPTKAIQTVI